MKLLLKILRKRVNFDKKPFRHLMIYARKFYKNNHAVKNMNMRGKRVGARKISKSETRQRSFNERSYDMTKLSMDKAYKRMKANRLNRHDKFIRKNLKKSHLNKTSKYEESRKSRSENNRSRHSSISSSTSLVLRESTESEILEQIHSFNLKKGSIYSQNGSNSEFSSVNLSNRRSSSTSVQRAFYVSELVKIQDSEMEKSMNVLGEILRQVEEFNRIRTMKTEK